MHISKILLLSLMALPLGACQTVNNVMADINKMDISMPKFSTSSDENISDITRINDKCPSVKIVDELSSLSEFKGSGTSESNLISRVNLSQVESSCSIQRKQVSIDLKLAFDGSLGAKAKTLKSDKPFFSYPFFVAVTNPSGVILAKEVFAASMTYERDAKTHIYYENLRQLIPIGNSDQAQNYKVMLGFQLTDDQLKYNRKHLKPITGASAAAQKHNQQTKATLQEIDLPMGNN